MPAASFFCARWSLVQPTKAMASKSPKLAGLPLAVIERAREVLKEHEDAERRATDHLASEPADPQMQLTMFTPLSQKIVDRLRDTDMNNLTPLEALNLLSELKKQIG